MAASAASVAVPSELRVTRVDSTLREKRAVYVAAAGGAVLLAGIVLGILRPDYWRPGGAILVAAGVTLSAIGLAVRFTPNLLALTQRELAGYFLSPIAYMLLFGMSVIATYNFYMVITVLSRGQFALRQSTDMVVRFAYSWPEFCLLIVVPIVTMRLLSEERRSGTIEVLLTAPVTEADVILSKFFAGLIFYMTAWLPWMIFLAVLRWWGKVEFDLGPPISAFIGLLVTGTTFISGGLFFSSLTRNQIVAAILAFAMMLALYLAVLLYQLFEMWALDKAYIDVMRYVSFVDQLEEFGQGTIDLRYVVMHLSVTTVALFITAKVLESRKWR